MWNKSTGSDKKFENPQPGTYGAICYRLIDLGTQEVKWEGEIKHQPKVFIGFELDENMEDGRPFVVGRKFTVSMHEKASLRAFLKGWRGRDFTDEELNGFNPAKLIGAPCMLSLVANGDYVNIASASKLPKGMTPLKMTNEPTFFSLDQFDQKVYDSLSNSFKEQIARSPEFQGMGRRGSFNDLKDDIPADDDIGF